MEAMGEIFGGIDPYNVGHGGHGNGEVETWEEVE